MCHVPEGTKWSETRGPTSLWRRLVIVHGVCFIGRKFKVSEFSTRVLFLYVFRSLDTQHITMLILVILVIIFVPLPHSRSHNVPADQTQDYTCLNMYNTNANIDCKIPGPCRERNAEKERKKRKMNVAARQISEFISEYIFDQSPQRLPVPPLCCLLFLPRSNNHCTVCSAYTLTQSNKKKV